MEQNAFENSLMQNRKRKRRRTILWVIVLLLLLTACGFFLMRFLSQQEAPAAGVRTYEVTQVAEGEISTNVSGSGQLAAKQLTSFTAAADGVVSEVTVQAGDTVSEGDVLALLTSDTIEQELDALYDELDTLRTTMARTTQIRSSRYFTAPRAGVIKDLQVGVGDNMEDAAFLCKISTDGRMQLTIATDALLRQYDAVQVTIDDETLGGYVLSVSDGKATVLIKDNSYPIGTEATVFAGDGTLLGSGTLELNEYITVAAEYGRILTCYIKEGTKVSKGESMFYMDYDAPSAAYIANLATEQDLLDQIAEKEETLLLTAPFDGLVTGVSVSAGDEVRADAPLLSVMSFAGYTLSVSVDELDIEDLALGQDVSVTFDSIDGVGAGSVGSITYEGSTGGNVTTFPVAVDIAYQAGTYPGSSASVKIIVATSGQTLLVPVDAVQYDGGNAFLYLAPDDATLGSSFADGALDLSALTKVSVTTGMSDGSYIAVSGAVTAQTCILLPKLTTTNSYSSDAETNTTSSFSMGGMGGGMDMPAGGFTGERPSGYGGNGQRGNGNG